MNELQTPKEVFDKRATEYQEKFMDVSMYADTFLLFCSLLPNGAHVLELACGPGNITKYLLALRPDLNFTCTDIAPKMIQLAKQNCPQATFQLLDCRDLDTLDTSYDAILCGFCLPYLNKQEALNLIHDACNKLNADGVLYISTMEDDYEKSGVRESSYGDKVLMYYHEGDYLRAAFEGAGFSVNQIVRKETISADGTKTIDLVMIGRKTSR
jgi:SAM-dependent methyltransferase